MKRIKIAPIFSMLILLGAACSSTPNSTTDTGNIDNSASAPTTESSDIPSGGDKSIPLAESTVDITLQEGSTTSAIIGPEGGTLSTIDANGTQYTLVIPENALFYFEEISMTPLASVEGEVIGDAFQAGVRLEPDGLHFFQAVSLEITGSVIEEGTVGFTSQADGQAFHLHPSKVADGSLTLNLSHFSDPGAAAPEVQDRMDLIRDSSNALLEHLVAIGNAQQQIAELTTRAKLLQNRTTVGLDEWREWTDDIFSIITLVITAYTDNQWNQNTPGVADLIKEVNLLIDYWYIATDDIVKDISTYCQRGDMSYMAVAQMIRASHLGVNTYFAPEDDDNFRFGKYEEWENDLKGCTNWILVWQANVETTGVQSFYSDISLGAEVVFNLNNAIAAHLPDPESTLGSFLSTSAPLEVEYIQGFWDGVCADPQDGSITLQLYIDYNPRLFWTDRSKVIGKIFVDARVDQLVYIDCSHGFNFPADAEKYFHGEALNQLNKPRLKDGFWEYELPYDPSGGVIAQFKEGAPWTDNPISISWDQGKWNLAQLVTLYAGIPSE